ncbi:MAG: TonB family protein [Ferruginibacter sp.]
MPVISVQTFSDASLTVLQGFNLMYDTKGRLTLAGYYTNNQKDRTWYYYNDTFKVIKKEIYAAGDLLETIDPDMIPNSPDIGLLPDEKDAAFKGGQAAWIKFLMRNLNPDAGAKSVKGGQVLVAFTLNKNGHPCDIYLRKSVELVLDEEALRVMYKMPDWEPAMQNGRLVNAYRVQPVTFEVR